MAKISDTFKPVKNPTASAGGRVTYENVEVKGATGEKLKEVGDLVASTFPEYTVWVTVGPLRSYDVHWQIDKEAKLISVDFFSENPGFKYVGEVLEAMKKIIPNKET